MIAHRALATAGLAALVACSSPRSSPCEGEPVGTFRLHAVYVADGGCPFAAPSISDFGATLAFGSGTTASLCLDRPEAEPLRGTHDGDHVTVSTPDAGANVSSCACDVQLSESVDGGVIRTDGGAVSGFSGELRDDFWGTDGGVGCERDAGPGATPTCGVPCQIRWQLTAAGG